MNKIFTKIISWFVLIVGAAEMLISIICAGITCILFVRKNEITQSDGYAELLYKLRDRGFAVLYGDKLLIYGIFLFALALTITIFAKAVGNFIYGICGLKAAGGINIKRARFVGTIALVIGICDIIDRIFYYEKGIGVYGTVYIILAALFLYCLNGIVSEKRGKHK